MKIIKPSYEIIDDISEGSIKELQKIEKCARICYKSEDKITEDGESAKRLIRNLIRNGHEAMLEHSCLSVKFVCDRGVSHELVRHRMASFAQESTRWCNYSNDKFGNEITVIEPVEFDELSTEHGRDISREKKATVTDLLRLRNAENDDERESTFAIFDEHSDIYKAYAYWFLNCYENETYYLELTDRYDMSPQMARSVLPNSLKTEIVVTANYREWRHILQLRTAKDAHPEMRRLMIPLLKDLKERIPVIFDDIKEEE